MISLNLKYTISETTSLEPYAVKAHILLKLKDENYRVQEITDNSVTFDDNPWRMMWSHQAFRRLDNGKFEFAALGERNVVSIIHYQGLWPNLIQMGLALFFAIFADDYFVIPFFGTFIFIGVVWRYYTLKMVGREMLEDILKDTTKA
jgi:hypothetical protein